MRIGGGTTRDEGKVRAAAEADPSVAHRLSTAGDVEVVPTAMTSANTGRPNAGNAVRKDTLRGSVTECRSGSAGTPRR